MQSSDFGDQACITEKTCLSLSQNISHENNSKEHTTSTVKQSKQTHITNKESDFLGSDLLLNTEKMADSISQLNRKSTL